MAKDKHELEAMTKDELVAYADDNDIDVQHSWLKDEIIAAIVKAEKKAASKPDSVRHHEDRLASIKDENEHIEQVAKEDAENQEIANFHGLPKEGETRDQLLDRIRKMREAPPKEPEPEVFRSEAQQKEFDAEQAAGKAAVAKAEEAKQKYEKALATADAEGEKK
jgi:hypothetical protein